MNTLAEEVKIVIDGKSVTVPIGTTLYSAALSIGIKIPTLCHHSDLKPTGDCRVCLTEIVGKSELVTACDFVITEPLEADTRNYRVWRERRDVINALFIDHYGWPTHGFVHCHTCPRDGNCQLQQLAAEYGVTHPGRLRPEAPKIRPFADTLERDPGKCVRCERCLRSCDEIQGVGAIRIQIDEAAPVEKGPDAVTVSHSYPELADDKLCYDCGQCTARCPTAALRPKNDIPDVRKALLDKTKHVVIQTAPAPRVGIAEEFGINPGAAVTWQLNTGLKQLGFDAVFDTCFSADLTIIEEGTELLQRLYLNKDKPDNKHPLPLLTSCCPSWVRFLEDVYPNQLPHLSSCKSPQQMMGALVKTYYAEQKKINPKDIVSVSLMPCVAKKAECKRPDMGDDDLKHVDYVLTTRECAAMFRELDIPLPNLPPGPFDDFFSGPSGSGIIFGHTGGVMEAALRTVLELVTGYPSESLFATESLVDVPGFEGCRIATITLPNEVSAVPALVKDHFDDFSWIKNKTLKVGVASGLRGVRKAMESVKTGQGPFADCHFIEMMSCPGGCAAGGGQPAPTDVDIREARTRALRFEDLEYGKQGHARKSHANPAVLRLYKEWLKQGPGKGEAHKLLHTHRSK